MKKSCGKVRSQDLFPCMEVGERGESFGEVYFEPQGI